ncbi:LOW QUALITY PROTEIN: cleavage and polyadenylation specificity factor subunit 2-like [Saccoglossus kowalevskii]|uniref:Cleavage and polyadenylation specificity factor subunit 2 n=1 Tax=Saccoglossus kowalevskii TaxID=10224 RepID=A0ABM0LWR2_SACKO|nr:PREDICTED: LOW QUALITY PROTEIN: cleavage and polyadenylation specificity factor subunit 2-like [Saccoglossus kowalevskii]
MTSIIKLTALSGAYSEGPLCYLLQVDEFKFLLDCGWDENFTMGEYMESLKKHIGQIEAVLLSYPDGYHIGALPYIVGKCALNCPIYATIPVYKMGQMFMYDLFQSRHNTEEFDLFTLDDVDAAFDKIIQLKYSQIIEMKGKGHGLTIMPVPAGHMIGGTIWRILKEGEEDIIYAVDYNHKKERHLNGGILESINRPALLITDAFNSTYFQAKRKTRDEQLMTNILRTMRKGGNVLVAVDTAGRVLELCQLLDQMWRTQESGLGTYSLALLNNVSYNVVEFAKSQVEWMSEKIMRSFEDRRNNPFQFKHLQLCHSLKELSKIPDPKTVLASVPDLECGYSRSLFLDWCGNPNNCIILTTRSSPGTLARNLIEQSPKAVSLTVRKRVRLEGSELEEYLKKEKEKEHEAKMKDREAGLLSGESSDESEDEMEVDGVSLGAKAKHDLMMKSEGSRKAGFFKQAKKAYPMFPTHEERIKWDDYGEIIKAEDYMVSDLMAVDDDKKLDKELGLNGDAEMEPDISDVPTKCISKDVTLDILCPVIFIDFEGRSDGESIRKIISIMKPKQVIIVHGTEEATESFGEYCRVTAGISKVLLPRVDETVDATMESHIFQVKLKDALVSSLEFAKAKDAELAWVDGQLDLMVSATDTGILLEEGELTEENEDTVITTGPKPITETAAKRRETKSGEGVPILEGLPPNEAPGHQEVFINEPRLMEFKQILLRNGIQAEFVGGVIICNNMVAVKRSEAGLILLEGSLCEDYFKIRELLYEQYAVV